MGDRTGTPAVLVDVTALTQFYTIFSSDFLTSISLEKVLHLRRFYSGVPPE